MILRLIGGRDGIEIDLPLTAEHAEHFAAAWVDVGGAKAGVLAAEEHRVRMRQAAADLASEYGTAPRAMEKLIERDTDTREIIRTVERPITANSRT